MFALFVKNLVLFVGVHHKYISESCLEYTVDLMKSLLQVLFINSDPLLVINHECLLFQKLSTLRQTEVVPRQIGLKSSSGFKKEVERPQWKEDLSPRQVSGIV